MMMSATASMEQQAPVRVRVAGLWRRATAGVIDLAILGLVFVVLFTGVSLAIGERLPRLGTLGPDHLIDAVVSGQARTSIALVVLAVVAFLYFFLFHGTRGQTPGKRLVGVHVIDAWGERPSLSRALVRTLAYLPSTGLLLLGFVWIAFDRERRGLHDWIADTYVVVDQATPPSEAAS